VGSLILEISAGGAVTVAGVPTAAGSRYGSGDYDDKYG